MYMGNMNFTLHNIHGTDYEVNKVSYSSIKFIHAGKNYLTSTSIFYQRSITLGIFYKT